MRNQRTTNNAQRTTRSTGILPVNTHGQDAHATVLISDQWSVAIERRQRRAGMILLLVIALLVLLALMGTVFILMASTDRKSAYAANSSASLNMAQQGVLNTVRGLMLNGTLDQNKQTLAVGTSTSGVFHPDYQIARFWDYPEVGAMSTTTAFGEFYQSVTAGTPAAPKQYAPSEPWLVSNQPYEPGNFYVPGAEVYYTTEIATYPFTAASYGRYVYTGVANAPTAVPPAAGWTGPSAPPTAGYAVASGQATTGVPIISALSPYLYDPADGAYDIGWYLPGATPPPAPAVADVPVPNAAVVEPRWAYNTGYNPASAESAGNMPVTPHGTLDAMWNLLPYSDPNGTRYRFAVRVVDMSSMLNLNTGWIANAYTSAGSNTAEATDPYGIYGAFIGSAPIMNIGGLNIDPTDLTNAASAGTPPGTPVQIGIPTASIPGRIGNYPNTTTFYSLPVWQDALSEYELQFPSSTAPPTYTYPTAPPAAYTTSLFGTNSSMDLLTGAGAGGEAFGSPFYSRVAALMPLTLGLPYAALGNYYGSGYRSLYTTYSWGRDVAAVNPWTGTVGSPWTTINGTTDTAPPKVNLNASVTDKPSLAALADNLYTAMVDSGYDPIHARAFLANYFTYRFDTTGYSVSPAYLGPNNLLTVPMGSSTISTPLTTIPAGVGCMGTTAQPFLNEVEVKLTSTGGTTKVTDWAVEVVNPFPNATAGSLPCSNYSISITGVATPVYLTGALGGSTSAGNDMFGVLAYSGGTFESQASGDGDGFVVTSPGVPTRGGTVIVNLIRNNVGGSAAGVVVDTMTITIPATIPPGTTEYYDVSKDNLGADDNIWGCDSNASLATSGTAPTIGTIGTPNGLVNTGGNPGVVLYDRWYSGDLVAPGAMYGTDLANINDFNCIARECATTTEPLTEQIGANIASTPPPAALGPPANLGMYYVAHAHLAGDPIIPVGSPPAIIPPPIGPTVSPEFLESALYFDFAYDPRAAFTAADAGFLDPEITTADTGDVPPTILSTTTLTDRLQSNPTAQIALPGGAADLVRQAGKININTAGIDVLYSAFSEDGALWKTPSTPPPPTAPYIEQLVTDAIGFRERLATGSPVAGTTGTVPAPGYNGYGGIGFQSPADLLVAFIPTIETVGGLYANSLAPTTIQQRDAAWADVENFLSVRSDTFAVYGLVQALRLNPAYSAEHANPINGAAPYSRLDWYKANQGVPIPAGTFTEYSISTDPTSQYAEFILEGTRRFIAIVDRSYCNDGALVQPHIVALKILPQ